jgi:hypothetical protein
VSELLGRGFYGASPEFAGVTSSSALIRCPHREPSGRRRGGSAPPAGCLVSVADPCGLREVFRVLPQVSPSMTSRSRAAKASGSPA